MSISTNTLTKRDINKILELNENHFVDLKSVDIAPGTLTETISAFANADGGELYVGIDENKSTGVRTWRGFSNQEAANGHIQIFDELFPLGGDFSYEFLASNKQADGLVLHIIVQKTREIKRASNGKVYIRRNARKQSVTSVDAIKLLERSKGISSFETETIAAPLDEVTNSEVIIEFMLAVLPDAEPLAWLRKQQLIQEAKPTVAALVLYSDEPQALLPKRCAIKIYRYRTTGTEGTRETMAFDPMTIEGCLYSQIQYAVSKTQEIIQDVMVLGDSGLENMEYPQVTLHEIITNAVLHRDYSIADDIHVRIFDNRIEVESPGRLPAHINETNIRSERFSRNGSIVRLINKFPNPPNKDVGEGINSAFDAMKKRGLTDPEIHQKQNSVQIDIHHKRLGSLEEIIMAYLRDHEEVTNRIIRELSGVGSENTVKDAFKRLAKANQIERVPGKNGNKAAWQKQASKTIE